MDSRSVNQEELAKLMKDGWSWRNYGASGSGSGGSGGSGGTEDDTNAYILVDESGNEVPAVLVSEETVFTATANDIREGTVAATEEGVTVGTKEIPAYHTTEGVQGVPVGGECNIYIPHSDRYNYTKLQAIICLYNTSLSDSVAADKVCINDNVYVVGDTTAIATVTLDHVNKQVVLGVTNDGDKPLVIRYFSYKEED